jgi:hypothetical protein
MERVNVVQQPLCVLLRSLHLLLQITYILNFVIEGWDSWFIFRKPGLRLLLLLLSRGGIAQGVTYTATMSDLCFPHLSYNNSRYIH